jgi:hypothetical protein
MKIQLSRATVVTPIGESDARIMNAGAVVDVEKADARLLVALGRAKWLKASDAEAAVIDPRGETADARPAGRSR